MSNSIATTLENLRLLRDAWIAAYTASLAAISAGVKPDYSVGGQSVSWQAVYTNGAKVIEDLTKQINAYSWMDGGPVTSYERP